MTRESDILNLVAHKLRPIDDVAFRVMAEDREFLEELLQVILDEPTLSVVEHYVQKDLANLTGRSLRIDTLCKTSDNRYVNIEVQKEDNDDHQRRVRYHAALVTVNNTPPGVKFKDIPDVCIIYISEFDLFKAGRALYQIERVVKQTGDVIDNGLTELYVFAKSKDGSKIAKIMEVLATTDVYNEGFPKTSTRKRSIFQSEKGKMSMCKELQELINKEKAELNGKISLLEDKNSALEDKNSMLESNVAELKNTIEAMKQTIAILESKLAN